MQSPGDGIRLRSSARTSRGRVRPNNQDSIDLWSENGYVLAVVADGMGGAASGEVASRIAVETIRAQLMQHIKQFIKPDHDWDEMAFADQLEQAVREANDRIVQQAVDEPAHKGMGTTLTMAFAHRADVVLAHVGDSRAYLIDAQNHEIRQVTTDHSFVQALVDSGHITPEEAEDHPMKNVLYRALGQGFDIDVDLIPDVFMEIGDRLVLCSDGLTLHVSPDEIAEVALTDNDPQIISDNLINLANARGGKDNVSVVVILVEKDRDQRSSESPTQTQTLKREGDDPSSPSNKTKSAHAPSLASSSKGTLGNASSKVNPPIPGHMPTSGTGSGFGEGQDRHSASPYHQ